VERRGDDKLNHKWPLAARIGIDDWFSVGKTIGELIKIMRAMTNKQTNHKQQL